MKITSRTTTAPTLAQWSAQAALRLTATAPEGYRVALDPNNFWCVEGVEGPSGPLGDGEYEIASRGGTTALNVNGGRCTAVFDGTRGSWRDMHQHIWKALGLKVGRVESSAAWPPEWGLADAAASALAKWGLTARRPDWTRVNGTTMWRELARHRDPGAPEAGFSRQQAQRLLGMVETYREPVADPPRAHMDRW